MTYLSTDLASPVSYVAGAELHFALSLIAPSTGTFYLLGAIGNTSFGLIEVAVEGRIAPTSGLGDVNQDGWCTEADDSLIRQIILGTYIPTVEEARRADVNEDGVVNIFDLTALRNYILAGAYLINSATEIRLWILADGAVVSRDCKLVLDKTNTNLVLTLMEMVGAVPSQADDIVIESVTVSLSGPSTGIGLDLDVIMNLMISVMIIGMMGKMMASSVK